MLTQDSLKGIATAQLTQLREFVNAELLNRLPPHPYGVVRPKIGDFRVGQRVTFINKRRQPVVITIKRINDKSVSGDTDDGMGWRASPGLLRVV